MHRAIQPISMGRSSPPSSCPLSARARHGEEERTVLEGLEVMSDAPVEGKSWVTVAALARLSARAGPVT